MADRCQVCDRPFAQAGTTAYDSAFCFVGVWDAHAATAELACRVHAVDWRVRCRAAEAERAADRGRAIAAMRDNDALRSSLLAAEAEGDRLRGMVEAAYREGRNSAPQDWYLASPAQRDADRAWAGSEAFAAIAADPRVYLACDPVHTGPEAQIVTVGLGDRRCAHCGKPGAAYVTNDAIGIVAVCNEACADGLKKRS